MGDIIQLLIVATPFILYLPYTIFYLSRDPAFGVIRTFVLIGVAVGYGVVGQFIAFGHAFMAVDHQWIFVMIYVIGGGTLASAAALAWMTRSWRVGLWNVCAGVLSLLILLPIFLRYVKDDTAVSMLALACLAWHIVTCLALRRWRIGYVKDHCARCGYDLVGLASDVCPECGAPVKRGRRSIEQSEDRA